ncbi:CvfB family protein [Alkaliflexus imshenetskii]|uniref:CvfB family protein n=1 Tax=Alkaliflexus imshenetskii TaxID=286730 RepID=UPI00047AFAB9|nr:S1-like domain-containing RNA-binding protein [Alkaliflexus imshenetskii]
MPVQIGKTNRLKVLRKVSVGVYLDGDTIGDVLLPNRYIPQNISEGDEIDVFIYLDSEDRLIATTEVPYAHVGECAFLKVVSVSRVGAFLDWGLIKDLFVPFREQAVRMEKDCAYVVYVYLDHDTGRIAASSKFGRFLDNVSPDYKPGDEVDLLIAEKTPLGFRAVINNVHTGMLYDNQLFKPLEIGHSVRGYIAKVRDDDKIDLLLEQPGYEKTDSHANHVLDVLKAKGGYLAVTDKSDPDEISTLFGMSKKNFKKALGALYKQRLVIIEDKGVRLV